jgi:hypothetical protein
LNTGNPIVRIGAIQYSPWARFPTLLLSQGAAASVPRFNGLSRRHPR